MTDEKSNGYAIGVVSDTHGQMTPALLEMLSGVDLIIHAGDIDRPEILGMLESIAPVVAVRGNMDRGRWAARLRRTLLHPRKQLMGQLGRQPI